MINKLYIYIYIYIHTYIAHMFFDFLYNSEKERCINLYGKIKSEDGGKSSKNVFETIEDNMEQYKNNTFQPADELAFDESRGELWSGKYLKAIFNEIGNFIITNDLIFQLNIF